MGKLFGGGGTQGPQMGIPPIARTLNPDGTPLPNTQVTPDHAGMFGIKGTFRDILGILGDSMLAANGGQAIYRPQREKEKYGDATIGMAEDPRQAVKNLSAAGFGDQAQKLLDNTQQNETMAAYREAQAAARQAQIDSTRRGNISSYAGALGRTKDPEASYQKIKPMLQQLIDEGGYKDYQLPDKYDPDALSLIANRGISPDKQVTLGQGQQKTDAYVKNLDNTITNRDAGTDIKRTNSGISQQNADTSSARLGETRRHNRVSEGNSSRDYVSKTFVDDSGVVRTLTKTGKVGTTGVKARPVGTSRAAVATALKGKKDGDVVYQGSNRFVIKGGKPVYSPQ